MKIFKFTRLAAHKKKASTLYKSSRNCMKQHERNREQEEKTLNYDEDKQ